VALRLLQLLSEKKALQILRICHGFSTANTLVILDGLLRAHWGLPWILGALACCSHRFRGRRQNFAIGDMILGFSTAWAVPRGSVLSIELNLQSILPNLCIKRSDYIAA
jgi:hypothetical protein